MRFNNHILLLALTVVYLFVSTLCTGQNNKLDYYIKTRGEAYIKLKNIKDRDFLYLKELISIDKINQTNSGNEITGYLNDIENSTLLNAKFEVDVLTPPSMKKETTMCSSSNEVRQWNCYPTYSQYVGIMEEFQNQHPEICKLEEYGTSVEGRKLLVVKISDNVNIKEDEPEFFYSSTMHGDETAGYVLMLRLIDYLLKNYSTDTRVSDLLNSTEIWINPLSNPDGTYYLSNNDIFGARRANSNGADLNRNFPDPAEGQHPDNNEWQKENVAMMDFMKQHNFTLSANFHGGKEVINYPWDTWKTRHPDDNWYKEISREYADTVHANSIDYMKDLQNGITNGADWYMISGGRQDYVNYYLHGREVTIEISGIKMPDAAILPALWNYNYRSLLNYIKRVHSGFSGHVVDEQGNPLNAKIEIDNHDADNSEIYSNKQNGRYYRLIEPGTYQVNVSKTGYNTNSKAIVVPDNGKIIENFTLVKNPTSFQELYNDIQLTYNSFVEDYLNIKLNVPGGKELQLSLVDLSGKVLYKKKFYLNREDFEINENICFLREGIYVCRIITPLFIKKFKFVKVE